MQDANVLGFFLTICVASILYYFVIFTLKRYVSNLGPIGFKAATPYGEYMGGGPRGFTECENVLTRSGTSSVFFDVDNWLSVSANVEHANSWITSSILDAQSEAARNGYKISGIAFVEKDSGPTGLISMQHLISRQTGMKTCTIRLRRWPFLPQAAIKGDPPEKDSNWLIISDVATTGGHIFKASKVLEHECWGAKCPFAIVLLNRGGDDVVEVFKKHGIRLIDDDHVYGLFQQREEMKKCAA